MTDILIIEDNIELANLIKNFLEKEGYCVELRASGEEGLEYIKNEPIKLLLLDIMLDGIDGFDVCSKVREIHNVPILIMSAKNDDNSKIICLNIGADDYLEKPFTVEFLTAKVNALLRRSYGLKEKNNLIVCGEIAVDTRKHQVFLGKKQIKMTVKEYDLLSFLMTNHGKVLSKDTIFDKVWGFDSFSEPSTLTVHIRWLREKLEVNPKNPKVIKTIWGIGYQLY